MTLEQQIFEVWLLQENDYSEQFLDIDDWEPDIADEDYSRHGPAEDQTEELIKNDMALALTSRTPYVRRYAELLQNDLESK